MPESLSLDKWTSAYFTSNPKSLYICHLGPNKALWFFELRREGVALPCSWACAEDRASAFKPEGESARGWRLRDPVSRPLYLEKGQERHGGTALPREKEERAFEADRMKNSHETGPLGLAKEKASSYHGGRFLDIHHETSIVPSTLPKFITFPLLRGTVSGRHECVRTEGCDSPPSAGHSLLHRPRASFCVCHRWRGGDLEANAQGGPYYYLHRDNGRR